MIQRFRLFPFLVTAILGSACIVFALIVLHDSRTCTRALLRFQEEKYTALIRSSADEMGLLLRQLEEAVQQNLFFFESDEKPTAEETVRQIETVLKAHPMIFGMEIIFSEEGIQRRPEGAFRSVYGWNNDSESIQTTLDRDVREDYLNEWFNVPYTTKEPFWSEPYYDAVPQSLMLTYSIPKLDKDGTVVAVFTGDISFTWIDASLQNLPVGKTGRPVLLSKNHKFIDCNVKEWQMTQTLESLYSAYGQEGAEILNEILTELDKPSGYYRYEHPSLKEMVRLYHQKVPRTEWIIGAMIPEKEVIDVVLSMHRGIIVIGVVAMAILSVLVWKIAQEVSRPIRSLCGVAEELAQGIFDTPLPLSEGKSEIVRLTQSFDIMRNDLKRYIADVTNSARAQERISAELNLAHAIQLDIVPKDFTPPRQFGVDVYATMEPAMHVGGDLYDFEILDDEHFYFCIGDVSGKGVPASLFMAVGKTLIKSTMRAIRNPAEVFNQVNKELMQHNQNGLFITCLCGILNFKTGDIVYSNAGHNPPITASFNQPSSYIDMDPGFPLALIDDATYENQTGHINLEETVVLYTDGATDAENTTLENFGSERLLQTTGDCVGDRCEKTISGIIDAIHLFAKGAPKQSDDITLLAFAIRNLPTEE